MAYSEKVLDHYENPRNVGSFPRGEKDIGTGVVGAPECGDVMKLQIKVSKAFLHTCNDCHQIFVAPFQEASCRLCASPSLCVTETDVIEDAKFKTFGCGSAIASSSYVTELVKGKTLDQAVAIKNSDIVEELSLPPVKIHCSVLAEDAIKAAIADWKKKKESERPKSGASEGGT